MRRAVQLGESRSKEYYWMLWSAAYIRGATSIGKKVISQRAWFKLRHMTRLLEPDEVHEDE